MHLKTATPEKVFLGSRNLSTVVSVQQQYSSSIPYVSLSRLLIRKWASRQDANYDDFCTEIIPGVESPQWLLANKSPRPCLSRSTDTLYFFSPVYGFNFEPFLRAGKKWIHGSTRIDGTTVGSLVSGGTMELQKPCITMENQNPGVMALLNN